MNSPMAITANKAKIGSCPHGMPAGACPICSGGMGGGGSKKTSKASGEMSWDECYTVWQQILKTKENAQQKRNDALLAQRNIPINFTSKLDNLAMKIANLIENLSNVTQKSEVKNQIMAKAIATIATIGAKLAIPILNVIKNVAVLTQKTINFIQQKFADISDKLNAIFGELKNSTEKKISDKLKDFKKKFKSLFEILEPEKIDDEDKKLETITEGQNT